MKTNKNLEKKSKCIHRAPTQNSFKKTALTAALFGILMLYICSCCTDKINSTETLMKEISSRYNGKWFTEIKFSQITDNYDNDSLIKSEIWDEIYTFPNNLIIYITPGDTSNKYIFKNDTFIIYENNELISEKKVVHDAVVLSMDIYNMNYTDIMKRWKDLPYNTDKFHEIMDNGKKVYVIGADKGDTISNQVWFDAEHLYFIKLIKQTEKGTRENCFLNYIQLDDKGWIEQEVIFKLNGKVYMREEYFNIQVIK